MLWNNPRESHIQIKTNGYTFGFIKGNRATPFEKGFVLGEIWRGIKMNEGALKCALHLGNNPMVGATVAVAVAIAEAK